MAVAITIRDVPDEVRDELAARAARSGRSLQEFLLAHLVQMASHPPVDDVVARTRIRVAATATCLSLEDILSAKVAERR